MQPGVVAAEAVEGVRPEEPEELKPGGGLHLRTPLGLAHSQENQIHDRWVTLDDTIDGLSKMGLPSLDPPVFECPGYVTAEQLTNKNNDEYSTVYAHQLGWFNYVSEIFAKVKAYLLEVNNELEDIEVKLRSKKKSMNNGLPAGERMNDQAIADLIHLDPRYQHLLLEKQKNEQRKLLIEAKLDAISRNLRVVSRQVTIRQSEFDNERVGANMPGRGGPRFPRS